jgi:hypothetical protein
MALAGAGHSDDPILPPPPGSASAHVDIGPPTPKVIWWARNEEEGKWYVALPPIDLGYDEPTEPGVGGFDHNIGAFLYMIGAGPKFMRDFPEPMGAEFWEWWDAGAVMQPAQGEPQASNPQQCPAQAQAACSVTQGCTQVCKVWSVTSGSGSGATQYCQWTFAYNGAPCKPAAPIVPF